MNYSAEWVRDRLGGNLTPNTLVIIVIYFLSDMPAAGNEVTAAYVIFS